MRRIDELKKEIIHEILNSEEYREYRRLQNSPDGQNLFEAMENLNKEYADMRNQDIVNRYLMTEITFCRYMSDIFKDIAEVIDVDLDFLG